MEVEIPEVGFGWIKRSVGTNEGYILIITVTNIPQKDYKNLLDSLSDSGLECLEISKDPEYQAALKCSNGIAVYVKTHDENDEDHSKGFHKGQTAYNSYKIVLDCTRKVCNNMKLKDDALEKLGQFKELLTNKGFDWEIVILAMPELRDLDSILIDK